MNIHIADADDWVGLYVDGKLVFQGHSLSATHLLDILKIPYSESEHSAGYTNDIEALGGEFPNTIQELGL
jgi:hypothetical protein